MQHSASRGPVWHRLSAQDVSYLKFETPARPMHFGAIARFAEPGPSDEPSHERIRTLIAARAMNVSVLTAKPSRSPLSQWPYWASASDEEVDACVQLQEPGLSEEHLLAVARCAMASPLPRDRPLWRVLVVPPADGETGFGILFLVHHSLIDGIAGLVLLAQLLDDAPQAELLRPHARPSLLSGTARDLAGFVAAPFNILHTIFNTSRAKRIGALWGISRDLLTPGRRKQAGNEGPMERHVFHLTVPRAKLRAASRSFRVTPNDLILSASANAVGSLVEDGAEDPRRSRVAMPVSLRELGAPAAVGNATGIIIVSAEEGGPSDAAAVQDFSSEVHRKLKKGDADGYQALCELTGSLGRWTQSALHRLTGRLGSYDILVTSLVGSSQPLVLAGARMEWICPMAQLFSNQVVSLAIAAYEGEYHLGILATDAAAGEKFANALDQALAEMTAIKSPALV